MVKHPFLLLFGVCTRAKSRLSTINYFSITLSIVKSEKGRGSSGVLLISCLSIEKNA